MLHPPLLALILENSHALMQKFGAQGVSPTRVQIMHELFHAPESTQAELQRKLNIDGAAITRHLQQMEADGLVTRRTNPAHKRQILVSLTALGQTFLDAGREQIRELESALLDGLSDDDKAAAVRVLTHISAQLSQPDQR